jgi:hypothetical protein
LGIVGALADGVQCSLTFAPSIVMVMPGVQTAPVGRGRVAVLAQQLELDRDGEGLLHRHALGLWLWNMIPLLLRAQAGVSARPPSVRKR